MRKTRLAVATLSTLLLGGCVPSDTFLITDARFNDKLRGDLETLSEAQRQAQDPGFGPYQLGSDQLLSPVWPVSSFRGEPLLASNMVQSDCVWLGRRGVVGDGLQLNYEQTWRWSMTEVDGQVAELTGETAEVGMCDGRHPVDRSEPHLHQVAEDEGTQVFLDTAARQQRSTGDPPPALDRLIVACYNEALDGPGHPVVACNPDVLRAVTGSRIARYREAGTSDLMANPDGVCRAGGRPTRQLMRQADDHLSYPSKGVELPTCGMGGRMSPERDADYALMHSLPPQYGTPAPVEQRFGPAVMVVDGTRTLRRGMAGSRLADTPSRDLWWWEVQQQTLGQTGRQRWTENFSPSLTVTQVRIRPRIAGGQPLNLSIAADLCIEDREGVCAYRCRGTAEASGAFYALNEQSCSNPVGTPIAPDLTPAFDNLQLTEQPGAVQPRPLRWRLADPLPSNAQLSTMIIEFDLLARTGGGAALRASAGALDFGSQQVGGNQYTVRRFEVINDGDVPMEITSATPLGAGAADFSVQFSGSAIQVPLPVNQAPAAPTRDGKWQALGVALSRTDLLPPHLQLVDYGKAGGRGLRTLGLKAASFQMYEQGFVIRNGVTTTTAAGFDFAAAGRQAFQREHPGVSADGVLVGRPFVFPAYVLRNLPLVLAPGERANVHVSQRVTALGERNAHLRLEARTRSGPLQTRQLIVAMRGRGVSGAILDVLPGHIALPRGGTYWQRNVAVVNVGESAGELSRAAIEGADAARFTVQSTQGNALPQRLGAGEVHILTVAATAPACGAPTRAYSAELALTTADGRKHLIPIAIPSGACQ